MSNDIRIAGLFGHGNAEGRSQIADTLPIIIPLMIVLVFLGICHSIVEDTLIFAALGANWWVMITI